MQSNNSGNLAVFVGASGYGNIGDDMYPLVLRKHFPKCNFIFKNSDEPRKLPENCMALIMGPGGIIYQNQTAHFEYLSEYMDQAMERKIPIMFLSCGIQSKDIVKWKKYFDYADIITLRSEKDVERARAISSNENVFYFSDLGYIFEEYEPVSGLPGKYTVFSPIAFPKEGEFREAYLNTPEAERVLLRMGSYIDTKERFAEWVNLAPAKVIFDASPAEANYVIKNAEKVYTGRYHGLVFSRKNNVECFTFYASQLKLLNEDKSSNFTSAVKHVYKLRDFLQGRIDMPVLGRVAIIHDDFSISGGGEKLVSTLSEALIKRGFEAEIFTFDLAEKTKKMLHPGIKINCLKTEKIKDRSDSVKRFLFSELDVSDKFDFFIFSGHASLCSAKKHKPNLLYGHSVPKFEPKFFSSHPYDFFGEQDPADLEINNKDDVQIYLNSQKNINILDFIYRKIYNFKMQITPRPILPEFIAIRVDAARLFFDRAVKIDKLKLLSYQRSHKDNLKDVQQIVVNSENIRGKMLQKYGRQSEIIYPPIQTNVYSFRPHKGYWLSINRLVPLKRVEIQLEAFAKLPEEKLLVIGDFENRQYCNFLKKIKPENVEFLGVVSEKEKISLLSECKGLVFTAQDEDFGMAVVEAMAAGKPVIAPNEGGCRETVLHQKTGLLLDKINELNLAAAIKQISISPESYKEKCLERARHFDEYYFAEAVIKKIS